MASFDDFPVFRGFGKLNVRTLLYMQDRISKKEKELHQLGSEFGMREEVQGAQEKLMDEIASLLQQYSKTMNSSARTSNNLI